MRRRTTLRAALAVVIGLAAPAWPAPMPPAGPVCHVLVVSPTVARDRTLFCATVRDPVTISSSVDLGRTWTVVTPTGFLPNDLHVVNQLVPSPTYADDHLLYVQTQDALYRSTDRGATLGLADPLGGAFWTLPALVGLSRATSTPPALPVDGVLLGQANGGTQPDLLQPPLRSKAAGAAGYLDQLLVSQPGSGTYAGRVIGFGMEPADPADPARATSALWSCDGTLLCTTMLASFPGGRRRKYAAMAADFASSGVLVFVTETAANTSTVWLSRDGGAHVTPMAGAQRILDAVQGMPDQALLGVRAATDPTHPGRVYLRVGVSHDLPESPIEQMFRSDDWGRTFRRIGYRRALGRKDPGPPGWPGRTSTPSAADASERMVVLADGRILALGSDQTANRFYCSTDGARSWHPTCR
jgi:hypothetical protein